MIPTITCTPYRAAVCSDRDTTLTLLLRVEAQIGAAVAPPSLNLGIALDRSGSMEGEPIEHAIQASAHLVDQLKPDDVVAAVAFDHEVIVLAPAGEAYRQRLLKRRLSQLEARGWTDLHSGFQEAAHQVGTALGSKKLDRVVILTDGQTNQGVTCPDRIADTVAEWHKRGISTTTIGLGWDYNEDLLEAMSRAGGGNFFHIAEPKDIAPMFQVELQGLSSTIGKNALLGVKPGDGVEVLRLYNKLERVQDGRIKLGNLMAGCPIELVLELQVAMRPAQKPLCRFELHWDSVESGHSHSATLEFGLPAVPFGQLEEFPCNPEVMKKRALQLALQCLNQAVTHIDGGRKALAEEAIREGLVILEEAGSSEQLDDLKSQFADLKDRLKRGQVKEARKVATYSMSSVSLGGGGLAKLLKEFGDPRLGCWLGHLVR